MFEQENEVHYLAHIEFGITGGCSTCLLVIDSCVPDQWAPYIPAEARTRVEKVRNGIKAVYDLQSYDDDDDDDFIDPSLV